ncbi:uncharacterized protein LOC142342734 [Convolutriloba macropyga]|uniref:uncharacterized protein LOC142342734 n=1 Tax=Convolutriloba macropyga TaxID=536237 RepID=UPI003F5261B9
MIEKRESSPTTLLSSTSDIEILNPMLPSEELSSKQDSKSGQSGISTNPLAKLAAACSSLCNDMKPRNTSPSYSSVRTQFGYPVPGANPVKPAAGQPLLASNLLANLSNVASSLQTQPLATQTATDPNYLLAQELLAKQQTGLALPNQGLTALETLAALQNANQAPKPAQTLPSLSSGSSNLEYLTKIYLQTLAAKKELANYSAALQNPSLNLVNSALVNNAEKLLSPGSASNLLPTNGTHLCNGVDYRLCPCTSCQTLRLNVLALQQNLTKPATQVNTPTQPQQHYLLPQKNPLTGTVQYISVCSDQNNCSICTKPTSSANNNFLQQPAATSPTGLTAEQYLAALTGQTQTAKLPTTPSPKPVEKASPDFSAPLQIRTSPSPTIQEIVPNDITCSWTENGAPCGRKFVSEEQLFDHIKKVHTSTQSNSQSAVPKQASPLTNAISTLTNESTDSSPLASLKNLSRKVLPEATASHSLSNSRYHPYARPSLHDSRLNPLTNQIAARQQTTTLPLLPSSLSAASQLPLAGTLGALNLPSVAPQATAGLPFSFSTNGSSQFVSANPMSSLLFAAAAR